MDQRLFHTYMKAYIFGYATKSGTYGAGHVFHIGEPTYNELCVVAIGAHDAATNHPPRNMENLAAEMTRFKLPGE